MAYSRAKTAVQRAQKQLEQLYKSRKTIDWATPNPSRLSYQLREAIHAAQYHEEFRHLADLRYVYEFRQLNGSVRAHYIGLDLPESLTTPVEGDAGTDVGASEMPTTRLDGPSTLTEVIGAMISLGDTVAEVFLPDAALSEDDLRRLYVFAHDAEWSLISHEGAGVTLTRRTVAKELLYEPND
jgi:hypothetical protein